MARSGEVPGVAIQRLGTGFSDFSEVTCPKAPSSRNGNAIPRKCSPSFDVSCRSTSHHGRQEVEPPIPYGSEVSMTLFIISIPLMVLAVVLAVLPLIVMSLADRHRPPEATPLPRGFQVTPKAEDEAVHRAA